MILIVVDTGPINYLIQIGHIDLLSTLADKTVLPSSVRAELLNDAAPANVRAWAGCSTARCRATPTAADLNKGRIAAPDRDERN
jgi:hypothetical protein